MKLKKYMKKKGYKYKDLANGQFCPMDYVKYGIGIFDKHCEVGINKCKKCVKSHKNYKVTNKNHIDVSCQK